jgi:hypothetical protein
MLGAQKGHFDEVICEYGLEEVGKQGSTRTSTESIFKVEARYGSI